MSALFLLGQALDVLTWAFLPPGAEMNPLGRAGLLSLAAKVALCVLVLSVAHIARDEEPEAVNVMLVVGFGTGVIGAVSNVRAMA